MPLNIADALKILTSIGAVVSGAFGLWQWLDLRRREAERNRFEQFHRIFDLVAGRTAEGKLLVDVQQAMAVYELVRFPEYAEIILPILDYYAEQTSKEGDSSLFRRSVLKTRTRLSGTS